MFTAPHTANTTLKTTKAATPSTSSANTATAFSSMPPADGRERKKEDISQKFIGKIVEHEDSLNDILDIGWSPIRMTKKQWMRHCRINANIYYTLHKLPTDNRTCSQATKTTNKDPHKRSTRRTTSTTTRSTCEVIEIPTAVKVMITMIM